MILVALLMVAVVASALAFAIYGFAAGARMPGSRVVFGITIGPLFAILMFALFGMHFEFMAQWG